MNIVGFDAPAGRRGGNQEDQQREEKRSEEKRREGCNRTKHAALEVALEREWTLGVASLSLALFGSGGEVATRSLQAP